jgi:hypothetical protein
MFNFFKKQKSINPEREVAKSSTEEYNSLAED